MRSAFEGGKPGDIKAASVHTLPQRFHPTFPFIFHNPPHTTHDSAMKFTTLFALTLFAVVAYAQDPEGTETDTGDFPEDTDSATILPV